MSNKSESNTRETLMRGQCIPAHPLALDASGKLDERHQRAITRYYLAAGVGGVAVGVHTTQFAIRDPKVDLLKPVLQLAAEEVTASGRDVVQVGGICGATKQATAEAALLTDLGYHAGLLSLAALPDATEDELIEHAKAVGDTIPLIGFYLQPAVGGRLLSYEFWRRFVEIEAVVAIKVAAFNRYQTLDVMRAVADSGRDDIAMYTGNDDNIVGDLITPFRFGGRTVSFVGGLLGHWAVWTKRAVELQQRCHQEAASADLLQLGVEVTDCNAAFFDADNSFHGCIAGLHEVLHRQGLMETTRCLDPDERLSPGQKEYIDRVYAAYPHLHDDAFVAEHRDEWLR